jgi:pyruvate-ferredoxin/flavodoxin oxidoreductase
VKCGYWPLYTYDPQNEQPFEVVSKVPEGSLVDFELKQNRFALLNRSKPEVFEQFVAQSQKEVEDRYKFYTELVTAEAKK